MMMYIMNFCKCIFEVFIFYDFLRGQLRARGEKKALLFLKILIMAVSVYGINWLHMPVVNLFIMPLILLAGMFSLFSDSIKKEVFLTFTCWTVMIGMEFVIAIVFQISNKSAVVSDRNQTDIRVYFLILIMQLLIYLVLRVLKTFLLKTGSGVTGKMLKITFLLPAATLLIYRGLLNIQMKTESERPFLIVGSVALLAANVLVFFIIEKLSAVLEKNKEYELSRMQNTLNRNYYGRLEEINSQQQKYAHNLKNCLAAIGNLAVSHKNKEIIEILKEMEIEIDSIYYKQYTSNNILNALLCEKEAVAQKKGIRTVYDVETGLDTGFIQGKDLIVMVGNLLDNALEASEQCENGRIELHFFSDRNFIVLEITNPYRGSLNKHAEEYLTTKKNAGSHGLGIRSVQETAENYGGILYTEGIDGHFKSILTLSKTCRAQV